MNYLSWNVANFITVALMATLLYVAASSGMQILANRQS